MEYLMKIKITLMSILSFFLMSTAQAMPPITPTPSTEKININKADASKLENSVKGIGTKRAQAIVKYRDSHNGFKSITDLAQVPGLGKNFVNSHLASLKEAFTV